MMGGFNHSVREGRLRIVGRMLKPKILMGCVVEPVMREIIVLGKREEICSIDIEHMGDEAEEIIEFIHAVAYVELLSRDVLSMFEWGPHVRNTFAKHNIRTVSDVMSLDLRQINRMSGCGHIMRKQVYEIFCSYGFKLAAWMPGHYWERMNYKFE